ATLERSRRPSRIPRHRRSPHQRKSHDHADRPAPHALSLVPRRSLRKRPSQHPRRPAHRPRLLPNRKHRSESLVETALQHLLSRPRPRFSARSPRPRLPLAKRATRFPLISGQSRSYSQTIVSRFRTDRKISFASPPLRPRARNCPLFTYPSRVRLKLIGKTPLSIPGRKSKHASSSASSKSCPPYGCANRKFRINHAPFGRKVRASTAG